MIRPLPDLFCVAFLGNFQGYFPTYSDLFAENLNYLTWAVLKAHTNNRAGEVTLRSADPRDVPNINFRYFEEGTPDGGEDLDSVVDGIKFVRQLTGKLKQEGFIAAEELPGEGCQSDEQLRGFRSQECLGPSCFVQLRHRAARAEWRSRQQFPRARNARAAGGGRVGVSPHSGLFHRELGVHDRREGSGRDPGRRQVRMRQAIDRHDPAKSALVVMMDHTCSRALLPRESLTDLKPAASFH